MTHGEPGANPSLLLIGEKEGFWTLPTLRRDCQNDTGLLKVNFLKRTHYKNQGDQINLYNLGYNSELCIPIKCKIGTQCSCYLLKKTEWHNKLQEKKYMFIDADYDADEILKKI